MKKYGYPPTENPRIAITTHNCQIEIALIRSSNQAHMFLIFNKNSKLSLIFLV